MRKVLLISFLILTNILSGQNNIAEKVSESFNSKNRTELDSIAKTLNYKGGDEIKVFALFTVNEEGTIVDFKARSVHPLFEKEAIRIIKQLPKMPVAESNAKKMSSKYALPIVFKIETEKEKKRRLKKEKRHKN